VKGAPSLRYIDAPHQGLLSRGQSVPIPRSQQSFGPPSAARNRSSTFTRASGRGPTGVNGANTHPEHACLDFCDLVQARSRHGHPAPPSPVRAPVLRSCPSVYRPYFLTVREFRAMMLRLFDADKEGAFARDVRRPSICRSPPSTIPSGLLKARPINLGFRRAFSRTRCVRSRRADERPGRPSSLPRQGPAPQLNRGATLLSHHRGIRSRRPRRFATPSPFSRGTMAYAPRAAPRGLC